MDQCAEEPSEMDAVKLLLAFLPWIAFWIISAGQSMFWLQVGVGVAAVLVVVMGITRLHRGVILWAGVVFFAFALVFVVGLENMWAIHHLRLLATGTLFVATLFSVAVGRPFTEDYAREHVPKELWDSPAFIRGCFTVTGVWGFIFLANVLINVAKLNYPAKSEWLYRGVELTVLVLGVVFTTIYSRIAGKKRMQLLQQPDNY
jgi:hypothetical protein